MTILNLLLLIIAAVAVGVAIFYRCQSRQTLHKLSQMLVEARSGNFQETTFDESQLSALESKLHHYLRGQALVKHQLTQEQAQIQGLISDISHQTKTPVANILLYAQLLGEQNLPTNSRELVASLAAQAEKLNFLISALVKASRLETGIITVQPQLNAVNQLMTTVQQQVAAQAADKGLMITVEPTTAQALFDLKWTSEALYNIVDNAVKYTPAGGQIRLSASAYELFCRLDIKDSGIGIALEEQNLIFGRFYRSSAVRGQEGVGIGLYLSREIIAAEGGYIKVSSQPSQGSTFSVFLPQTSKSV